MSPLEQPQSPAVFRAYQEQRRPRFRLRYILTPVAVLLVTGLGAWVVSYRQEVPPIRVDTYRGLKTVRQGMSPQDVSSVLGQPIGKERRGNLECFQYGRPSIRVPYFNLHTVCYEGGKLHDVTDQRYNSWLIAEDGAVYAAPYTDEPQQPTPTPSATPVPGDKPSP